MRCAARWYRCGAALCRGWCTISLLYLFFHSVCSQSIWFLLDTWISGAEPTRLHIYIYIYVHTCVYTYIYIHVYSEHMYTYIHICMGKSVQLTISRKDGKKKVWGRTVYHLETKWKRWFVSEVNQFQLCRMRCWRGHLLNLCPPVKDPKNIQSDVSRLTNSNGGEGNCYKALTPNSSLRAVM